MQLRGVKDNPEQVILQLSFRSEVCLKILDYHTERSLPFCLVIRKKGSEPSGLQVRDRPFTDYGSNHNEKRASPKPRAGVYAQDDDGDESRE